MCVLAQGGDLRKALWQRDLLIPRVTWWDKGKSIAMDIARGLAFLHDKKIMFRDLKSANILLTRVSQSCRFLP